MSFPKLLLSICIFLLSICVSKAQQYLNLDFEFSTPEGKVMGWRQGASGFEAGVDSNVFYSGRKSFKIKKVSEGSFGVATTTFPVSDARGKHLLFTGWIKTEGITNGYAGLWWRNDSKEQNKSLGFDNMYGRGPAGTSTWTKYSIEMDIDSATQAIKFGVLLPGNGAAWFDNLQIELDGKIYEQKTPKIFVPTIENVTRDLSTAQKLFQAGEANSHSVQNLRAFAKIYGYVRFFHPSDEASKIDWDKFALYGADKIKYAKDDKELKETLRQLFLPFAPTAQIYSSSEKLKDFSACFPKDTIGLKVIAWQHFGIGLGEKSSIYNSKRINRNNSQTKSDSNNTQKYAPFSQSIDAISYRGKEIKLLAKAKAQVSGKENNGHLWLKVNKENKQIGFFNNMDDRPIVIDDWKEYEIIGTVDKDAKLISFGGFLRKEGKIWFDDFKLFFRDKDEEWQQIKIENPGFEVVDANDRVKSWFYGTQGYIYVIDTNEKNEGGNSFSIEKISDQKLFSKYPNIGETINEEISPGLFCNIPLALYSDKNSTLGPRNNNLMDSLLFELGAINLPPYSANYETVRLGNVINAWNVFQHFYPYFDVVKVDWDNVLTETLTEALKDKTSDQFYNTLKKMVAKLQDGHGYVYYSPEQKIGGLPISVGWIENQLVITGSQDSLFKKGDIIENIDGVTGEETLLNEEKFVSGSPQLKRFRALNEIGNGLFGSIAQIQLIRSGNKTKVESKRQIKNGNLFFNNVFEFTFPRFKKLENDIYYINASVTKTQFFGNLQLLSKAKGIIFDQRFDGSTRDYKDLFQPSEMIKYLIDTTAYSAWWNVPQTIYPNRNGVSYEKSRWTITPSAPRIKAKIVFINDPAVVSYGESYTGIFENYKLGEFVGESTAGTNGNVNFITLPGGFKIMFTGMKVIKNDGSQHHLIGIKPTYTVQRTIKAVKEGRDEYLEKAIEVLKEKIMN